MSCKYRIIGAIIGFLVFNIIGAIIGYFIGQAMDEEQFKQKYKPRRPSAKKAQTSPSNTTKSTPSTLKSATAKSNTTKQKPNNSPSPSNTKQCQQDGDEFERSAQKYKMLGEVKSQTTAHPNKSISSKIFGSVETSFDDIASSLHGKTNRTRSHLEERVQQELALGKLQANDLKPNWNSYLDIIQHNNISHLYHFTAAKNINQIKQSGGLLSWYAAEQKSLNVPVFGGDNLSRNLDRRYGNHDYVHLSFCDDHPMSYRLKQNGEEVVVLEINPIVAVLKDTIFSDINAADRSHHQGGNIEDLQRINFEATRMRFVSRDDPNFKPHQAEVMVKRFLPARYIDNLDNL
mgnify:CR=1 FL=1